MQTEPWTVLVAGGGYAGVLAANRVQGRLRGRARVWLVTPDDSLTDRIRLHQTAVHGTDFRRAYAELLSPGVVHLRARVVGLEPEGRGLHIESAGGRRWWPYDALILALGSGLAPRVESASPLSAALRDHAHAQQLARALPKLAAGERVVVVGGGLSAVELSAEIAEVYPQLKVELLTQQLGEGLHGAARSALAQELCALGVTVREGVKVEQLQAAGARLEGGELVPAALSVLASGFAPTPLPAAAELARGDSGRVLVDAQLRVMAAGATALRNVFAAGDFAEPPASTVGTGLRTTRMGCVDAMPLGAHAADQVARLLLGEPLRPFHFNYVIQCISLGRQRGAVVFVDADDRPTGRVLRGRVGALVKEVICRFVIGALRLERLAAGLYGWPSSRPAARLPRTTTAGARGE